MKLNGYEAIAYAEVHGLTLSKYADPVEDARECIPVWEAKEIAEEDPGLIYIDISE
ncbi:MAG: hypothetical protein WCS21_10595 [Lachnospiraceae bacterium]